MMKRNFFRLKFWLVTGIPGLILGIILYINIPYPGFFVNFIVGWAISCSIISWLKKKGIDLLK